MQPIVLLAQLVVAFAILNVWLIRSSRATSWRGGQATNMKEEFAVYGLPDWFMMVVGLLKVSFALLLVAGIWVPEVAKAAAAGLGLLMAGAIWMHAKVNDPFRKHVPALTILGLCTFILVS